MAKKVTGMSPNRAAGVAYDRECHNFAVKMRGYEHLLEQLFERDVEVYSMSIRHPKEEYDEYLITVRAYVEGKPSVTFHAAPMFYEALEGILNRMRNANVKWKPDQYAKTADSK